MQKVHLDTDLGGDLDDLCALAMLLRWQPAIEITGITVVGDTHGQRTGMVRQTLEIAGRRDIPVAAGADTSQGFYPYELGLPPAERYWPRPLIPAPNPPERAVALLKHSIDAGATIIGIGPLTNFYLLEQAYPGTLARAQLFLMGGYLYPPRAGLPQWNYRDDFNVQVDVRSAHHVLMHCHRPTLITLASTAETALRHSHLEPLWRKGGALGQLIVRQAEHVAVDEQIAEKYCATCEELPADIINFQHDALACAVALGWREGIEIEEFSLHSAIEDNWLTMRVDPTGSLFGVITKVDGPRFSDFWLQTMIRNNQANT